MSRQTVVGVVVRACRHDLLLSRFSGRTNLLTTKQMTRTFIREDLSVNTKMCALLHCPCCSICMQLF